MPDKGRVSSRADLSLTALAIYDRLRPGNWHPSEYEDRRLVEQWYARISQAAAEAAVAVTAPARDAW